MSLDTDNVPAKKLPAKKLNVETTYPRRGLIVVADGQLVDIRRRLFSGAHTSLHIWWDSRFRTAPAGHAYLYYTASRRIPGYLTVDYARSGRGTSLQSIRLALSTLDRIAVQRQSVAIFAHVGTSIISDRLLLRWGWQSHAPNLRGRHWIKRFSTEAP